MGAITVVTKDVPENVCVVDAPARIIERSNFSIMREN